MFLLDELEVRLYTMVSCCNTNTSMTTCGQRIRDILLKGVEADVSLPLALISLMFVSLSHPPCSYKNHETPKEKEKEKQKKQKKTLMFLQHCECEPILLTLNRVAHDAR